MPYKSIRQQKWAHTPDGMEALGGADKVAEWDAASKGRKLPPRARKAAKATGPSQTEQVKAYITKRYGAQ